MTKPVPEMFWRDLHRAAWCRRSGVADSAPCLGQLVRVRADGEVIGIVDRPPCGMMSRLRR